MHIHNTYWNYFKISKGLFTTGIRTGKQALNWESCSRSLRANKGY